MSRIVILSLLLACGGTNEPPKPIATTTTNNELPPPPPDPDAGSEPTPDELRAAKCSGTDLDLMAALLEPACERDLPKDMKPRDLKSTLSVKVNLSAPTIAPGAHVDVVVVYSNTGKDPITLDFIIDPVPHVSIEAYDAKGKRPDMPAGNPPPPPKGVKLPDPMPKKLGTVTLRPGATAKLAMGWDAVKTKWAPEKVKGSAAGSGYPRAPAGSLPKGTYKLKVITPLTGVTDGAEPTVEIIVK